ncbi:MAG: type 2 lanthipeptide synthetase LanM [Candidatus Nanopelagicales bacterium]
MDVARAADLSERLARRSDHSPPRRPDPDRLMRWTAAAARGDPEALRRRVSRWSADPAALVAELVATGGPATPRWWAAIADLPDVAPGPGPLGTVIPPLLARADRVLGPTAWFHPTARSDLVQALADQLTVVLQTGADRLIGAGEPVTAPALWHRFPVLARLAGTAVGDWVAAGTELHRAVVADHADLAALTGAPVTGVHRIRTGLSDRHGGGRTVSVLTCTTSAGERRVVHKPHSLSAELLLGEVLRWCDARGLDLGAAPAVVLRRTYGWAEFVEDRPTTDPARYFRRAGGLAAVLFALGGNDCHAGNLIACGDQPVIIDAETVLQPALADEDGGLPPDSILDGLLLPRWLRVGGTAVEMTGLGAAAAGQGSRLRRLEWTDTEHGPRLRPRDEWVDLAVGPARAKDGTVLRPDHHAEDLLAGFRAAWDVLQRDADALLAGPLADWDEVRVRVLVRMTRTYVRIAQTSLHPDLLADGLDRSLHLEHLARFILDRDDWREWLDLIDEERDQMEGGDIPSFSVAGTARHLRDRVGAVLAPLAESAADRAERRLAHLSPDERQTQEDLIVTALAVAPVGVRTRMLAQARAEADPDLVATHESVRTSARSLLDVLMAQTRRTPTGLVAADRAQWGVERHRIGWYDGTTGILVATAAAAVALDDASARERARGLLGHDLAEARSRPGRLWRGRGIGGQDGVGGILVGWAAAARLLPESAEHVAHAVDHLLRHRVPVTGDPDLLRGSGGLLAGLLAARSAGLPVDDDYGRQVSVATVAALPAAGVGLNGFSHGDAGAAAVLSAAAAGGGLDDPADHRRPHELLLGESRRYDPDIGEWRDLRVPGRERPGPGWCNGAPGMALARIIVGDPGDDLPRLAAACRRDVEPRDNLCCGAAGRAEVLRAWSEADPRQRAAYDAAVSGLVARTSTARLRLGVPPGVRLQPLGMFQGVSGVLVALAGWLSPTQPHVLAWGCDTTPAREN